ncbi:MAG TPA: glycosyltransferase [Thermoanaerobaculia bacterium]|nr:glycosyltransferase [Thermoanaerobaculia bacterium]
MSRKLLILSASAGAGHVRAAQALERTCEAGDSSCNTIHVDALEYTNAVFRKMYAQAYIDLVNRSPELLGWLYDALDQPWKHQKRRLALDKLNTGPLVKLIEREAPEAIVSTHFLPAEIVSWLKEKGRIQAPHSVVVTDFDVHAMWLSRHTDTWFVALEETREHLARLGVSRQRIFVTGIPIDPAFAENENKQSARRALGLDPALPTILISAGGFGVGPVEHMITSLRELQTPAQVVVICGKNEDLFDRMSHQVREGTDGTTKFHVVGFTREMQRFMSASDLLVGKPGGLTTSEALAKGLVMVIVNPIPGQEERNADHLLERGAAIRCNNLPILSWKIDQLLADKPRFERMRERARELGRPHAARDIVRTVLASIPSPGKSLSKP